MSESAGRGRRPCHNGLRGTHIHNGLRSHASTVGAEDMFTVAPGSRYYSLMRLSNTYEQVDGSEKNNGLC